ncbi:MAG: polysaccharide biosynthesis tyrosine autokinase [Planctomycetes bacterium]|nr:polysaccharide biosynthesis tyrosine autokinase [Planctomycetota bacterium]
MINKKQPVSPGYGQVVRSTNPAFAAQTAIAITPKEIIDILRRHVLLICILTFCGAVIGGGLWFVIRRIAPKYTARTYIEVLSPGQFDPTVIGTPLASKDIAYEFRFSKAALIKQQSMLQELIRRDAIRETEWFAKFDNDVLEVIEDLEDHLMAIADRNSNYISIGMTCGSAEEAALIVNEMVDLFVKSQQSTVQTDISGKLRDFSQQENELRNKLQSISSSLTDIRRSSGLTQLESAGEGSFRHTITQKLGNLEIEKMKLEADIEQIRTSVASYEERKPTDEIVQRSTENDSVVLGLIQRIATLEAELARKMTTLGENHREVKQLREVLRQTIVEKEARSNMKSLQIRDSDITSAKDQFALISNRLAKLEEMRAQTENQQRDLDNTRATYDGFISRREEAKNKLFAVQEQISKYNLIKQDVETAKVKPIGLAPPPLRMSSPRIIIYVPGGTFLGFMLGIGLAFLMELLNDLLRTPKDVMKYVNVSLLGMVAHKDLDSNTRDADMWKVVRQLPLSMMSECYRQFRTNLKVSVDIESQRVIFITSGNAEEGRTTVAANTAAIFAAEGRRVLLIDANFRRPCLNKIFSNSNGQHIGAPDEGRGLSGYLIGNYSAQEVIRPTGLADTDVIDSGALPNNPAELLGGRKMHELLEFAKQHYDRVIIDGPPMLVSDAKALASLADGTVLVFNTAITRRGTAQRIVRELKEINTNILGAILIGVRVLKGGYYSELFESYRQYQDSHSEQLAGQPS